MLAQAATRLVAAGLADPPDSLAMSASPPTLGAAAAKKRPPSANRPPSAKARPFSTDGSTRVASAAMKPSASNSMLRAALDAAGMYDANPDDLKPVEAA